MVDLVEQLSEVDKDFDKMLVRLADLSSEVVRLLRRRKKIRKRINSRLVDLSDEEESRNPLFENSEEYEVVVESSAELGVEEGVGRGADKSSRESNEVMEDFD